MLPSGAQKISIEQFKRVKKDLLNQTPLPVDKKQATLDLLTDEKGNAVHRTRYSDNFITLLPGEQETILVCTPYSPNVKYQFKFNENMQPTKIINN